MIFLINLLYLCSTCSAHCFHLTCTWNSPGRIWTTGRWKGSDGLTITIFISRLARCGVEVSGTSLIFHFQCDSCFYQQLGYNSCVVTRQSIKKLCCFVIWQHADSIAHCERSVVAIWQLWFQLMWYPCWIWSLRIGHIRAALGVSTAKGCR